jgi:uncharacterized protein YceK
MFNIIGKMMYKIKIIFLCLYIFIFFSNCGTVRYYQIGHESIPSDKIFMSLMEIEK